MLTNENIATAILNAAIADLKDVVAFVVESTDGPGFPCEGAVLSIDDEECHRVVFVYISDENVWMTDACDLYTGEVNPLPLTAKDLHAAIEWLCGKSAQESEAA